MIEVSIIIPHYNLPQKLDRLLASIPDMPNIEIIVVDDKSDKYLDTYGDLKTKYPRVDFYDNQSEKKGSGIARNIGIEKSKGTWLIFADSDDYFTKDFYCIIERHLHSEADIIFFTPTSVEEDTGNCAHRHVAPKQAIDKYLEAPTRKNENVLRYLQSAAWSKMIKSKLVKVNKVKFGETLRCEDGEFSYMLGFLAAKIEAFQEVIYTIVLRKGSLTTIANPDVLQIDVEGFIKHYQFLRDSLSEEELEELDISPVFLFKRCMEEDFNPKAMFVLYKKMKHHGIKVVPKRFRNPLRVIRACYNMIKRRKIMKKYFVKESN